jgi:acyl carrier protein
MSTIQERVVAVTSRVLRLDSAEIRPEHAFSSDLGAESVQSIELIAMFEEEFGIEMEEDAAMSVQTVGGAADFIAKVCQEQGVKAEV